jgi:hypothetical protein
MMDRELFRQALEALEQYTDVVTSVNDPNSWVTVADGGKPAREAITALRERLAQSQMQPCAGRNCGSTNPKLHSAECFEDYEKSTGMAQPEQEPVAWMYHGIRHDDTPHERPSLIWKPEYMDAMSAEKGAKATPLYTAPPQRKPLTDEEIERACVPLGAAMLSFTEVARAIERAHGIGEQHE